MDNMEIVELLLLCILHKIRLHRQSNGIIIPIYKIKMVGRLLCILYILLKRCLIKYGSMIQL